MTPNQPGAMPKVPIAGVKNLIAVGSGKGGVGKTTVSVNLAVGLASLGYKAGLMDADVYGPNVPLMMGINRTPMAIGERIQPLDQFGVKLMSMGFLNPGDKPLVWRGPMLHSVIQQFLRGVDWGELDYLVIDLPPGNRRRRALADPDGANQRRNRGYYAVGCVARRCAQGDPHVPPGEGADPRHRGEHELPELPALPRAHRRFQPRRRASHGEGDGSPLPGRTAARSAGPNRRRHGQSDRAAEGRRRAVPGAGKKYRKTRRRGR